MPSCGDDRRSGSKGLVLFRFLPAQSGAGAAIAQSRRVDRATRRWRQLIPERSVPNHAFQGPRFGKTGLQVPVRHPTVPGGGCVQIPIVRSSSIPINVPSCGDDRRSGSKGLVLFRFLPAQFGAGTAIAQSRRVDRATRRWRQLIPERSVPNRAFQGPRFGKTGLQVPVRHPTVSGRVCATLLANATPLQSPCRWSCYLLLSFFWELLFVGSCITAWNAGLVWPSRSNNSG